MYWQKLKFSAVFEKEIQLAIPIKSVIGSEISVIKSKKAE